jgi:hypothetical protein
MANQDLIQRVADELDIRNVIAKLGILGDGGSLADYADLIKQDARWEMAAEAGKPPLFPAVVGRDAIVAAAQKRRDEGTSGPGSHNYHLFSTIAVDVAGDAATAITYLVFLKSAHKTPEVALFRTYRDKFVRTSDGWKLAHRFIDAP